MSQDRRRQKKLEQKRKKRQVAQKQARLARTGVGEGPRWRQEVSAAPFGPSWISSSYDEEDEIPALVTLVLTRKLKGKFLAEVLLVDRTCLGVKNAMVPPAMSGGELEDFALDLSRKEPLVRCEPLVAQSVLYHALDFARSIGFAPQRDFEPAIVAPRPEQLEDTPWSRPERPLFVAGPYDDVPMLLAQLNRSVGEGNYDVVSPVEDEVLDEA